MYLSRRHQEKAAAILALLGLICLVTVAFSAPVEPAGCANNTCVQESIFQYCNGGMAGQGFIFGIDDCSICATAGGRCQNGNTSPCKPATGTDQTKATCTDTQFCLCASNTDKTNDAIVQAQKAMTVGMYKAAGTRQTCQPGKQ
jgi:hypothetical protein